MYPRIAIAVGCGIVIGYLIHSGIVAVNPAPSNDAGFPAISNTAPPLSSGRSREISPAGINTTESVVAERSSGTLNADTATDVPDHSSARRELLAPPPGETTEFLTASLQDPDAQVRELALERSLDIGVVLPADALTELLRGDPSEPVRALAFRILTQDSDAAPDAVRATAEIALADSSESIRTGAQDLLAQMDQMQLSGYNVPQ